MKIRINGQEREFSEGMTVTALLEALGIEPRGVAVEVNREIVPRALHGERRLKDGDSIEIVRMVGGG